MKVGEDISISFCGIDMSIKFTEKINLLAGYSGTGKTLLMKAITLYCSNNKIPYRYIDYNNKGMGKDEILAYCKSARVVMLDNADLYISDSLLSDISKNADIVILSLKQTQLISMDKVKQYIVRYDNMKLSLE